MKRFRRALPSPALVGLVLAAALPAEAQVSDRTATAVRITEDPPSINGRMDEAAWQRAVPVDGFRQRSPDEGAAPTEETTVYILYDDEAIYIGARMASDDPSAIATPVTRRDGFSNAELLTVSLDTYLDRRTAVSFSVSSAGVRSDVYHGEDNEHRGSQSQYNPVWEAAARVDSAGWTAEMRIPLSQLRFNARREQEWGMNIRRWTPALNESDYWVLVPTSETGFVSRFGTLTGLVDLPPPRRIEVMPYVAGDATAIQRDPEDPFSSVLGNRFGTDAKIGIGPNLTLDLTINPDFGQVEADPAEVNLTAFETFFDERRPFFIEGDELLKGIGPDYYYSRRIGARPHGGASGDYVRRPDNTTIAGAAKLTGRLASGLSIGALASVTPREHARTYDLSSGDFDDVGVEPPTGFGVVRVQQEFGAYQSTVGASLTGVHRSFGGDAALASIIHREAFAGGADLRLRSRGGEYVLTGYLGFSHVNGDPAAIALTQMSSAHYYQRPDADHVTFDPLRRSLSGYTASIRADKNAGRRILWGAQVSTRSPGFEINDLGRLSSADAIDVNADIQIRDTQPTRFFRSYQVGTVVRAGWNHGGDRQQTEIGNSTRLTFHNFWSLHFGVTRVLPAQSDFLTRGGPSMGTPAAWEGNFRLSNGYAAATRWRVHGRFSDDALGGWRYQFDGGPTFRPVPALQLSVDPSYSRSVNARQYVGTLDGGRPATFGKRYVFGIIERSTLAAKFRVDYAFTPDLTVEGYAEPFAASGRYSGLGELSAPRTSELRTYGTDGTSIQRAEDGAWVVDDGPDTFTLPNRDFSVLSFRSNLVVRWEWRPGSTFFLVWQQDRSALLDDGDLVRFGSLADALRATGNNFFALKLTYWLSAG